MFGPPDNSWYYDVLNTINEVVKNMGDKGKKEQTASFPYQPSEEIRSAVMRHFAARMINVTFSQVPDFGYQAKIQKT